MKFWTVIEQRYNIDDLDTIKFSKIFNNYDSAKNLLMRLSRIAKESYGEGDYLPREHTFFNERAVVVKFHIVEVSHDQR